MWYTDDNYMDREVCPMREIKDTENRRPLPDAEADGIIEGRNAVIEALRTETAIDKIYIAKGETDKTLGHIASKARAAGIVVVDARPGGSWTPRAAPMPTRGSSPWRPCGNTPRWSRSAVRRRQGRGAAAGGVRRDIRPPQPGRDPAYRRVRRRHGSHPQAAQRRADGHRGQDLRRRGELYPGWRGCPTFRRC